MKIDPEAFSSSYSDAAIEPGYSAWEWTAGLGIAGLRCARKALAQPNAGEILIRNCAAPASPLTPDATIFGDALHEGGHSVTLQRRLGDGDGRALERIGARGHE